MKAGEVANLIATNPGLGQSLATGHPFIKAEVVYAIRTEMAQNLPDILMRRIRLGLVDWRAALEALPATAELLAAEMGWAADEREQAEASFRQHIEMMMTTAGVSVLSVKEKA